jgi:hypothetical protein
MAEMNPWLTPPTWSSGVPWVRFGDLDRRLPRQDVEWSEIAMRMVRG